MGDNYELDEDDELDEEDEAYLMELETENKTLADEVTRLSDEVAQLRSSNAQLKQELSAFQRAQAPARQETNHDGRIVNPDGTVFLPNDGGGKLAM